ncbi:MAG: SAM-dependent methyltransferase [Gemmatimonadota bacterium]
MKLRFLHLSILVVSGVGIAYELVLVRVFSVAQWYHLAYMVISMAMLGFAASGTVLGLMRTRLAGREASLFRLACGLLPIAIVACYAGSQRIPFETYQLVSRPTQFANLLALYLVLSVPFFLVSSCIVLGFQMAPRRVGRVYFSNLLGSGLGAALGVGCLFLLPVSRIPYVLALIAVVAFALSGLDAPGWLARGLPVLALTAVWVAGRGPTSIRVSEYKGLAYALRFPDAAIVGRAVSPISELTAVSSSMLRETPGQISNYPMAELGNLPEQIGLFFDAGAVSPVHRFDGSLERFVFLDHVTSALPYHILDRPRVLVLGAGGGVEVLSALVHGAREVTAVEVEGNVYRLLETELREFSGGLYERPEVRPVVAEGRGFLAANEREYDLIQISLLDSFSASSAGVHALNESYLYTVEAIALYLRRLSPRGILAITRWLRTPPRDAVKLFATMVEGCESAGIVEPGRHLAFIRSWNTGTILASRSPLSESQVAAIRDFAEARWFDRSYHPGLTPAEVNRYTVLAEPAYHEAALDLLSAERERFYRAYPFYVRPATDDRPYFFRFIRLRSLPRFMRQFGRDWVSFVEWGYILLVATVAQAAVAAIGLVLIPLILFARGSAATGRPSVSGYFGALGLAYMFLEIAFIQKFMLFLSYPVYAVAVVLTSFLLFSALGAWQADRHRARRRRLVGTTVVAIVGLSALYLLLLPPLFTALAGWSDAAKILASLALLSPLAFLMGVPFPAGLQVVSDRRAPLVPWAWGINGGASVVGATLATLLAVHAGFRAVVAVAVLLYGVAVLALQRLDRADPRTSLEV